MMIEILTTGSDKVQGNDADGGFADGLAVVVRGEFGRGNERAGRWMPTMRRDTVALNAWLFGDQSRENQTEKMEA
ncbi:MAG: hypothetical protein ACP5HZ_08585 [Ferrimicrobium sp.]